MKWLFVFATQLSEGIWCVAEIYRGPKSVCEASRLRGSVAGHQHCASFWDIIIIRLNRCGFYS